jgi:hypothetical protein
MSELARPESSGHDGSGRTGRRRLFRRGPWENTSALVIGAGLFMLMQPFALALYTYSFVVILAGTVAFLVTSHFPE